MILALAHVAALASGSPPPPPPAPAPASITPDEGHGDLPWFEGTFEELLARAEKEKKLVFLDFWTEW